MKRFESYGGKVPGLNLEDLSGWLIAIEGTDGVGRTTHINRLRLHLEQLGYAVAQTGLSQSYLASRGLNRAKQGNTLNLNAMTAYYATDFADRFEHQIVPALRAGFVMLTDRYVFSLMARAIVRGVDADWVKRIYSFALKPDAVFHLRIDVPHLVPRVLSTPGGFDYWESGMDIPLGEDLYDSFVEYQKRLIGELDTLGREYGFENIDATRTEDEVAETLAVRVERLLEGTQPYAHSR